MPKQKTHKGLSKRVKITTKGKIIHKRSFGGHLMSGKGAKRRRRVTGWSTLENSTAKALRKKLGK